MSKFRYLNPGRLPDIIAAIQVIGAYEWRGLGLENWEKKLDEPGSANRGFDGWEEKLKKLNGPANPARCCKIAAWSTIFHQHPEFFRLDQTCVSLRWRDGFPETYDPQEHRDFRAEELVKPGKVQRDRLEPRPLTSGEIETLINTAIKLHTGEIAHDQQSRWRIQMLVPLAVA